MLQIVAILGVSALVLHGCVIVLTHRERVRNDRRMTTCVHCGYHIDRVGDPICPECGAPFPDPNAD